MSISKDITTLFRAPQVKLPYVPFDNVIRMYKERPSFFTPYSDAADFANTLALPVVDPLVLSLTATAHALGAIIGAVFSSATFILAAGAALVCASDQSYEFFQIAMAGLLVTALYAKAAVEIAISAMIGTVCDVLKILTRTIATTIDLFTAKTTDDLKPDAVSP